LKYNQVRLEPYLSLVAVTNSGHSPRWRSANVAISPDSRLVTIQIDNYTVNILYSIKYVRRLNSNAEFAHGWNKYADSTVHQSEGGRSKVTYLTYNPS